MFSCISRALNTNNALSLPKLQAICNAAYKTKSVISHMVLENNFDWKSWLEPHCLSKATFTTGLNKVCNNHKIAFAQMFITMCDKNFLLTLACKRFCVVTML